MYKNKFMNRNNKLQYQRFSQKDVKLSKEKIEEIGDRMFKNVFYL